jgi:prophage DNA circulation protein
MLRQLRQDHRQRAAAIILLVPQSQRHVLAIIHLVHLDQQHLDLVTIHLVAHHEMVRADQDLLARARHEMQHAGQDLLAVHLEMVLADQDLLAVHHGMVLADQEILVLQQLVHQRHQVEAASQRDLAAGHKDVAKLVAHLVNKVENQRKVINLRKLVAKNSTTWKRQS